MGKRKSPHTPHTQHSYRHKKLSKPNSDAKHHYAQRWKVKAGYGKWHLSVTKSAAPITKAISRLAESSQHNDSTEKYFKVVLNKKKHRGKTGISYYTHQQSNVLSLNQTGKQAFGCLFWIGDITNQLLAVADDTYGSLSAASASSNLWGVNPFDMNPNQLSTGGTTTRQITTPNQDQVIWHNCKGEHQIMNSQSVTTTFTLYYFTPKCHVEKDSSAATSPSITDPVTNAWGKGIADVIAQAQLAWNAPIQRIAAPAANAAPEVGPDNGNIYGSDPFRYPFFNKMFKVLHVEKHSLQPGSTKKIKFDFEMNCKLDKQYLQRLSENSSNFNINFLAKKAVFCYIIARSVPVVIANEGEDKYFAPGPINLVSCINYTNAYSYPEMQKRRYQLFSDVNYPSATFGVSRLRAIDDTDEPDDVKIAQ